MRDFSLFKTDAHNNRNDYITFDKKYQRAFSFFYLFLSQRGIPVFPKLRKPAFANHRLTSFYCRLVARPPPFVLYLR